MIIPSGNFRIFIATEPVDFRKGMDGLVAHIVNSFDLDPDDGAIWLFRSRRADRLKLIVWDGTGLVLVMKRLNGKSFVWLNRPTSTREIHDAKPVTAIETSFKASDQTYDARRVWRPRHCA